MHGTLLKHINCLYAWDEINPRVRQFPSIRLQQNKTFSLWYLYKQMLLARMKKARGNNVVNFISQGTFTFFWCFYVALKQSLTDYCLENALLFSYNHCHGQNNSNQKQCNTNTLRGVRNFDSYTQRTVSLVFCFVIQNNDGRIKQPLVFKFPHKNIIIVCLNN